MLQASSKGVSSPDKRIGSGHSIKRVAAGIFVSEMCAAYPIFFVFFRNAKEIRFSELTGVLLLYLAAGLCISALMWLLFRGVSRGTVGALLCILFLSNYYLAHRLVRHFLPSLKYWHILPIGVVILLHLLVLIHRKLKEETAWDIVRVLVIVFAALFLINAVPGIRDAVQRAGTEETKEETGAANKAGPNIYWMIFDEYASARVIQDDYGYDNSAFVNELTELGFTVSEGSHNECRKTHAILTNCLLLDYVYREGDDMAEMERARFSDPLLYQILTENGYTSVGIGDTHWLGGIESVSGGDGRAKTIEGLTAGDLILKNSVAAPFLEFTGSKEVKVILDAFAWLQDPENLAPDSSTFHLFYVCSPHQPFLFDENGGSVSSAHYSDWDDQMYYLGQYIYVTGEIEACVRNIVETDPHAVIILQSDHGPRYDKYVPEEDQREILNAVYFGGENIEEINGCSSVNTWRKVLNRLFSMDLEEVSYEE